MTQPNQTEWKTNEHAGTGRSAVVPYETVASTRPQRMRRHRKPHSFTIREVTIVFLIQMALFLTVEAYLQYRLGMAGLALTELIVLALALLPVFLLHGDAAELFPVRRVRLSAAFGSVVFLAGLYLLVIIANSVMYLLFREEMVSMFENSFVGNSPFLVELLVTCFLPAVCEEAMHRGLIQSAVGARYPKPAVQAAIMGIFFAIFHLYPIRYPVMFIMGFGISYVFAITGNMAYSSLMHFCNNLFATIASFATGSISAAPFHFPKCSLLTAAIYPGAGSISAASSAGELPSELFGLSALGILFIFYGTMAVLLLYLGDYLIRRGSAPVRPRFIPKQKEERSAILWNRVLGPIIALVSVGVLLLIAGNLFT